MTAPAPTLDQVSRHVLQRAGAYAADAAASGSRPALAFDELIPAVRSVVGATRLVRADPTVANAVLDRLTGQPDLAMDTLRHGGPDALTERVVEAIGSDGSRSVDLLAARAVQWAVEFWAIAPEVRAEDVRAATAGLTPVWTLRAGQTIGGAAGIGAGIGRIATRGSGRSGMTASALTAQGQCRVWITDRDWLIARTPIGDSRIGLPVVFDRFAREQIAGVTNVWPRLSMARQLEIRFADGSSARFVYASKGQTLDLLVSNA